MSKVKIKIHYIGGDAGKADFVCLVERTKILRDLLSDYREDILTGNAVTVELEEISIGELINNTDNFLKIEFDPSLPQTVDSESEYLVKLGLTSKYKYLIISVAVGIIIGGTFVSAIYFYAEQRIKVEASKSMIEVDSITQEEVKSHEVVTNHENQEETVEMPSENEEAGKSILETDKSVPLYIQEWCEHLLNNSGKDLSSCNLLSQFIDVWCGYTNELYRNCYSYNLDRYPKYSYSCRYMQTEMNKIIENEFLKKGWDINNNSSLITTLSDICYLGCNQANNKIPAMKPKELCLWFSSCQAPGKRSTF